MSSREATKICRSNYQTKKVAAFFYNTLNVYPVIRKYLLYVEIWNNNLILRQVYGFNVRFLNIVA